MILNEIKKAPEPVVEDSEIKKISVDQLKDY